MKIRQLASRPGARAGEEALSGGGDRKSEEYRENQIPQSEGNDSPKETAERLAKEHGMSRATVERSADLFRSHQAVIGTSKPISPPQDEYIPWPA